MSFLPDTASLACGINAIRAGYAAKQNTVHALVAVAPWTRRDINDMIYIRDNLRWMLAEMNAGHALTEKTHGPTIRNIAALDRALTQKALAQSMENGTEQRASSSHITARYIWRTQNDDRVRADHADNNGKVFEWNNRPLTGHPGEDWGCRCWAEPLPEYLEEKARQDIINEARDIIPAWTRKDFLDFFFLKERKNRRGSDEDTVTLLQIGHLQNVINAARVYNQGDAGGGTIFNRVARDVFRRARKNGAGTFSYNFTRSYKFGLFVWALGKATVKGQSQVHVADKGDFLIITTELDYHFYDRFADPYDTWNVIPGEINIGGIPYHITGTWRTRLEAVIKKDSITSRFPDNVS